MIMEKIREGFESAIAAEAGEPILSIFPSRLNNTYSTSTLHFPWWAWKKSRGLVQVELPPMPLESELPENAIDDSWMDAYNAAKRMRAHCVGAVESAGLNVKP